MLDIPAAFIGATVTVAGNECLWLVLALWLGRLYARLTANRAQGDDNLVFFLTVQRRKRNGRKGRQGEGEGSYKSSAHRYHLSNE